MVTVRYENGEYEEADIPHFEVLDKNLATIKVKIGEIYYKINVTEEGDLFVARVENRAPACFGKILSAIYNDRAIEIWKNEMDGMSRHTMRG